MLLLLLLLLLACLLQAAREASAIHASEVPEFTWRVRATGCPAMASVTSEYGRRAVAHSGPEWSAWVDFNATDTKHWLATYPDTSEQVYDNYFPLVTVVIIRAPPSCYNAEGLLAYEMSARVTSQVMSLTASLDDSNLAFVKVRDVPHTLKHQRLHLDARDFFALRHQSHQAINSTRCHCLLDRFRQFRHVSKAEQGLTQQDRLPFHLGQTAHKPNDRFCI